ncbi:MAG: zinc ribbon domain-containing protein, partial [Armatimonadetes bacterium]|nr:zinc ribbon domain-containing protein [Armatimonadota bacterium]
GQRDELACPRCGAPIVETDTQCVNCGADLYRGRLVDQPSPQRPGLSVHHGIAEVQVGDVEYRTVPDAAIDWGSLSGGGFFDALSRSWRFFVACLRMVVDYPLMLLPSFLTLLVAAALLGAVWAILHFAGLDDQVFASDDKNSHGLWFWVVSVPLTLLVYAVVLSFMGMTVHMVDAYLRGRRATLGQALADVMNNFSALFYLALVNIVISILLSMARGRGERSWRNRAVDAADRVRDVANHLVVPVIMIEDKRIGEALKRAYQLFSRSILDIVIAELGLLMLNKVVGFVVVIFGAGALVATHVLVPPLFPLAVGSVVVAIVVATVITGFVRTAYYTCLYLWAAAMEALGTESVPAPAPLAKALAA